MALTHISFNFRLKRHCYPPIAPKLNDFTADFGYSSNINQIKLIKICAN